MMPSSSSRQKLVVTTTRLSCVFAAAAIVLLILLLFLRPDIDPSHRMISDYAIGRFGWVMTLCFVSFSLASVLLLPALASRSAGKLVMVGLIFLSIAAIGLMMAALFRTDPMFTAAGAATTSGRMHGFAFMLGVPGELISTLLLTIALRHRMGRSLPLLGLLTAIVWISFVILITSLMAFFRHPTFDQPAAFGWANRLFMVAFAGWLIAAAKPLLTVGSAGSET